MPSYTITNQYGTALSATIEATDGTTALALYVGSQYVSTRKSEWIASLVRREATIMADGSVAWESFRAVPSNRLAPVAVTIEPAAIDGIRCAIANGGSIELASDAECAAVYAWALSFASDCEWQDIDGTELADMRPGTLVRLASNHYDGDMAAMVADAIADAKRADDATIGRCEHGALLAYCTAEHATPMSSALTDLATVIEENADNAEPRNCPECSQSLSWHFDGKPCEPMSDDDKQAHAARNTRAADAICDSIVSLADVAGCTVGALLAAIVTRFGHKLTDYTHAEVVSAARELGIDLADSHDAHDDPREGCRECERGKNGARR